MNNHNNWGSQPPRQAYNGLPQMPPQPGYQQQYGTGNANAMAYIGNQQYQPNSQFLPPPNHQMQPLQPMPHYAQPQAQPQQMPHSHSHSQAQAQTHHAHNFHAQHHTQQHAQQHPQQHQHQQQHPQQHPQQHYSNGAYAHHAPAPHTQYMTHPNYAQPHQAYHQPQQVATPSPRQMQHSFPAPRQQPMAHPQLAPQQPQPVSRPPPPRPPQPPPQQNGPHVPSPQLQQRAPISIGPSQLQQRPSHVPSPQQQNRIVESINPNQLLQSQSHVPSPRPQPRAPNFIDPAKLQEGRSPVPSPQQQQRAPESIDPSQLLQRRSPLVSSQSQPPVPDAIDPSQLHQAQSHVSPAQLERPVSDAIDPSKLHQPQSHETSAQPQRQEPDAIDPSKLHQPQSHAQLQRRESDVIDPSQLMLQTYAPARKSMPSATSATKSPSIAHAHSPSQHFDTPAVLTCVANDCFRAAHSAVQDVATSLDQTSMDEYYKLIATGLGCLEAALTLNKLPPRAEANVRLRYATILSEETDNLTEAEVALTKGITVCEKNRLTDLKYCMQFQLLKVLYRRNRKAALVALDKNISEATTYKAVDWVYAFRFLRASFHLQSGNPMDTHAMDNLRNIASLASHRGDLAIAVLTSLLEGIIHLRSRKEDSIVRVQHCIAQAARFQLDPSVHIPQIEVLTLLLDLACSLQQKAPQVAMQKLKSLQIRMDELVQTSDWDTFRDELLLPLKRQPNSSTTVTADTNTIIRPGGEHNFIVMSFVTKVHAFVLAYVLSGLALLYHGSKNEKVMEYWTEALNMLAKSNEQVRPRAYSLPMAIEQAKWCAQVGCYIHTLVALISATRTQWSRVHDCISKIDALRPKPEDGRLGLLVLYVKGVYFQGTGELEKADRTFSDPRFDFAASDNAPSDSAGTAPPEVSLLAALNRIWIMQEPSRRDDQQTTELLEKVRPYCADHADVDIRTAFNLVAAAIETNPPQSIQTVKRHISTGLKFAQAANNTQLLGIALNLMRSCLFDSVVGDQAVKSAKAGRAQAQRAGNLLWMSVGEGMLAQTEEMQGQVEEAERLRASGTVHAHEAFVKPESS